MNRGGKDVNQINVVCGQNKTAIDEIHAGDIGAAVKLERRSLRQHPQREGLRVHIFDFIDYPASTQVPARHQGSERERDREVGRRAQPHARGGSHAGDRAEQGTPNRPSYRVRANSTCAPSSGTSRTTTKIQIEYQEPRIPYRETITKAARADYRHKKQSGGSGQFGEVHLIVEPYREGMPEPDTYKFGNQEYKMNIKDKQEIPLEWGRYACYLYLYRWWCPSTTLHPRLSSRVSWTAWSKDL